jgi:uncharacterized glyoxalase superfamily protein PhnB
MNAVTKVGSAATGRNAVFGRLQPRKESVTQSPPEGFSRITPYLLYEDVDDVDAHYEAAKAAGAHIFLELADQYYGDRTYGAEDPEGHQWSFAQHVRDVDPEDMHP